MAQTYIKKHGLLYSSDFQTLLGVDDTSTEFAGKIPYGVKFIDDEVFTECPYQSVSVPDSVLRLGKNLFENSKKLETVKLPVGIKELPPYLFSGCSSLYKVTMPSVLSGFPQGLFKDCSSLEDIPFRAGIKELPEYVLSGCSSLKALVIPNTVEKISSHAVSGCVKLESLVLPECIKEIDPAAFECCNSLRSIRINGQSPLFFVNEDDGCLYKYTENGDELVIKINKSKNPELSFFCEDVDKEPVEASDDEEIEEDDTFFSAEIGASDEEVEISQMIEENTKIEEGEKMNQEMEDVNINEMLSDIMSEERERESAVENAGLSPLESQSLTESEEVKKDDDIDGKVKILMDGVEFSQKLDFEPSDSQSEDSDLFVIAEKLVTDEYGCSSFSQKLVACCKKFARIQDFKHVILLYGLPLENDEFLQFYYHYISKKNVILACDAESPSKLSDYCKKICEVSRISLDKDELNDQRKRITVKSDSLIKLVIRDKYE